MELTIATLNEVLLPPFLFIVVFCFLCCQLNHPRKAVATIQPETEPVATPQPAAIEEIQEIEAEIEQEPVFVTTPTVEEFACDIWKALVVEPHPLSTEMAAAETAIEADLKPEAGASQQPEVYAQVLAVIDELGKREARKLCSPLGIQQKRNGIELSKELMVASIKREFKAEPDRVIEVIRDRLPELLLPAYSDPIQLVS